MQTKTRKLEDFKEFVTFRLEPPNANLGETRRFYYAVDANRTWKVEVGRDLRILCQCNEHWYRWKTGQSDVCSHVQEAMEFIDQCGWNALPTWNKDVRVKKEMSK